MRGIGGNIKAVIQTYTVAKNVIGEQVKSWVDKQTLKGWLDLQSGDSKYTAYNAKIQESTHIFIADYAYQGDGDLAAIGVGETVSAAARGENITIVFANNSVFGMTGGQMAPTTMLGEKTSTCRDGRDAIVNGYPIGICEMLATLQGTRYIARASLHDVPHILQAKKMIRKAFEYQLEGKGYSFVELLCACPTNLRMSPVDACRWVGEEMTKVYPLGVFKEE